MNEAQINSLIRSILKLIGAWLVSRGLYHQGEWFNSPDVCGAVVVLIGFWLSHRAHAAPDAITAAIREFTAGSSVEIPQAQKLTGETPVPLPQQ